LVFNEAIANIRVATPRPANKPKTAIDFDDFIFCQRWGQHS
jgi:hypothetical protein